MIARETQIHWPPPLISVFKIFFKINSFSRLFDSSSCLIRSLCHWKWECTELPWSLGLQRTAFFLVFFFFPSASSFLFSITIQFAIEVIEAVRLTNFAEGKEFGRKLSIEERHKFYSSPNTFRLAKSRRKRWVRHVAYVRYLRNAHINFRLETPEGIKGRQNRNEWSKDQGCYNTSVKQSFATMKSGYNIQCQLFFKYELSLFDVVYTVHHPTICI